jgi:hypothetical protein
MVSDGDWLRWIIAFFNGFLIFASAFGLDAAGAHITQASRRGGEPVMRGDVRAKRRFFIPWSF